MSVFSLLMPFRIKVKAGFKRFGQLDLQSRKAPVKKTVSFLAYSCALFSHEKGAFLMKIDYTLADGRVIEIMYN